MEYQVILADLPAGLHRASEARAKRELRLVGGGIIVVILICALIGWMNSVESRITKMQKAERRKKGKSGKTANKG